MQASTHLAQHMDREQQTAPQGSDAVGRPSRYAGPVAGAVLQGRWSETSKGASQTMANVTQSHGNHRQQVSRHAVQEGVACEAAGPANLSQRREADVP